MRLIIIIILFYLGLPSYVFGQSSIIDSLKNELSVAKHDTTKINILIDLAYECSDSSQLKTAFEAYQLARKVDYQKFKGRTEAVLGYFYSAYELDSGISLLNKGANRYLINGMTMRAADAFWFKGAVYEFENELDSALSAFNKSVLIAQVNNHNEELANAYFSMAAIQNLRGQNVLALNNSFKAKDAFEKAGMTMEIGQTLNQIGIIYDQQGLYAEALDSYLRALDISIETSDIDGEILISNNLGVIYDNMNNPEKASQYYSGALEKTAIHGMKDNEATLLNNLSYIYLKSGDTTQALSLLKESLKIDLSESYPCFESYPMEGVGSIYIAQGKLDSAKYYLDRALSKAIECEDIEVTATITKDLGILYSKLKNKTLALEYLEKSLKLSRTADLGSEMQSALYELYKFYKTSNNPSTALIYLESYQEKKDSTNKANQIEKATQLAAEYEFRKQIEMLEAEREASDMEFIEELQSKNRENNITLIAMVLFGLLAISLGRSYYVIQKNNKKLKWLNEEKNTLMGVVAHDLRNPLNMIQGLMQLIEDTQSKKKKNEDQAHYLDLIKISTDKMRNMIDRVLDISAIEDMKVNLNLERKDLAELMLQSSENFKQIAAQKNIEIQNIIDSNTSFHSNVDPNYFDQIMDNLLSNAIKFSEMGKKIYLKIESDEENNVISVIDEGPGIDEKDRENLFKKFTKLTAKPTSNEQSTGLGLSIVQKFVLAMNGEINCKSKVGKGTTFSLKFKQA